MPRTSTAERPRSLRRGSHSLVSKAEAIRIARESGLPWATCEELVKGLVGRQFGKRVKYQRKAIRVAIEAATSVVVDIRPISPKQLSRLV